MSQIQAVKEAHNIIDVIGERISLQRSGSQFKGLCPFHSEKSPSFYVSEQMQRYKCFGCGEAGDVFTFLEKYDGMSFAEALEYLAEKANIQLEKFQSNPEDEIQKKLLDVLNLAAEYYHYLLTKHKSGEPGRKYYKDRGISQDSVTLFKLGFSLDEWDGLVKYLHGKKKYSFELLEKTGLVIKGRNGYYDRFRGRVMYPLRDHRGRVVGFSGRVIDPSVKEAKYINTPETALYHKSKMLYGYHELYRAIREAEEVLVTEGEMDVISASQAHVNNIVAIKGSALTIDHARLLSRTVKRVILALDNDSAGVKATKRAIQILRDFPIELRVVSLGEGKDIDDLARSNPKLLRETTKRSVTAYEFLITNSLSKIDITQPAGKRQVMVELAPVLNQVEHAVELEHYIGMLSEQLGVQKSVVRADLARDKALAPLDKVHKSVAPQTQQVTEEPLTRRQRLERYILFLILRDELTLLQRVQDVSKIKWADPFVQQIVSTITGQQVANIKTLAQSLTPETQDEVLALINDDAWTNSNQGQDTDWQQAVMELRLEVLKDEQKRISAELSELDTIREKTTDQESQSLTLIQELTQINKELSKLSKKR